MGQTNVTPGMLYATVISDLVKASFVNDPRTLEDKARR